MLGCEGAATGWKGHLAWNVSMGRTEDQFLVVVAAIMVNAPLEGFTTSVLFDHFLHTNPVKLANRFLDMVALNSFERAGVVPGGRGHGRHLTTRSRQAFHS